MKITIVWGVRLEPPDVIECADQGEAERLAKELDGELVHCTQVVLGSDEWTITKCKTDTMKACA